MHNLMCLASLSNEVDKIYAKTCRDLLIMLKYSPILQAWQHPTLHVLHNKGAGNARHTIMLVSRGQTLSAWAPSAKRIWTTLLTLNF